MMTNMKDKILYPNKKDGESGLWVANCENDYMQEWFEQGFFLQDELDKYNWQYREKICLNCPVELQQKLNCLRVDNFANGIQETHCYKLANARTKKFRKKIEVFLESHPLRNGT